MRDAFATPLGDVPIDREAVARVRELPQVVVSDPAHAQEHALEVQLPFLQTVLGEFSLVPFAVGQATPAEVAEVLDALWGGPETLVVVSSDLSHYHPYAVSRHDRSRRPPMRSSRCRPPSITSRRAARRPSTACCGARSAAASRRRSLDLRNSGDTAGDRSRVVGYAAFAFVDHVRAG